MRVILSKSKWVLIWAFALGIIAVIYQPLFSGFFQQDEWLAFSSHILLQEGGLPLFSRAFSPTVGHFTPLNFLSIHVLFALFGLNYQAYAAVSLFLHLTTTTLVLLLARLVFKDIRRAFFAAFLFGILVAGSQATTWVIADISFHGAAIFGILSLIFIFVYLKKKEQKYIYFGTASLLLSVLFKEITLPLLVILPVTLALFSGKIRVGRKELTPIFIVGGLYLILRVYMLTMPQAYKVESLATQTQTTSSLVYNLITFPEKAIAQTVVPVEQILKLSRKLAFYVPDSYSGQKFTSDFDIFVEQKMLEVVSLLIFAVICSATLILWRKDQDLAYKRVIIFGLAFVMLGSWIFALSPERTGVINVIDSRYLYFSSIGTVILFVGFVSKFAGGNALRMLILFVPVILLNVSLINKKLISLSDQGIVRKSILTQVKSEYPELPPTVIFYTDSDTQYYLLSEKIMPFQSGLGQTLLIWYAQDEKFDGSFLKDKFLWEIRSQGYKEAGGRGFGYFRDYDLLRETVKKYKIPIESVIAFSWQGKEQKLFDITAETRQKLKEENSK